MRFVLCSCSLRPALHRLSESTNGTLFRESANPSSYWSSRHVRQLVSNSMHLQFVKETSSLLHKACWGAKFHPLPAIRFSQPNLARGRRVNLDPAASAQTLITVSYFRLYAVNQSNHEFAFPESAVRGPSHELSLRIRADTQFARQAPKRAHNRHEEQYYITLIKF